MESKAVFFFVAQAGWWFHFFNFHRDLWWNDPSWLITHIFQLGGSTTNFSKMIFVIFTHSTPLATLHWPRTSQPPRLGVGPHFHYSVTPKNCQGNKNWWTKQMSFSQFPPIFWTIFFVNLFQQKGFHCFKKRPRFSGCFSLGVVSFV